MPTEPRLLKRSFAHVLIWSYVASGKLRKRVFTMIGRFSHRRKNLFIKRIVVGSYPGIDLSIFGYKVHIRFAVFSDYGINLIMIKQ